MGLHNSHVGNVPQADLSHVLLLKLRKIIKFGHHSRSVLMGHQRLDNLLHPRSAQSQNSQKMSKFGVFIPQNDISVTIYYSVAITQIPNGDTICIQITNCD